MIRVRQIIETLSYDDLVARAVIPDLVAATTLTATANVTKKYPPFIYASKHPQRFSYYGMFMDYFTRAGLHLKLGQAFDFGVDPASGIPENVLDLSIYEASTNLFDIAGACVRLCTSLYHEQILDVAAVQAHIGQLTNILKGLTQKWQSFGPHLSGKVCLNTEYATASKAFAGHPDITVIGAESSAVLDIKNTSSFPKMAKEACLQVLAYYALMKLEVQNVQFVGFVLPMQREVVIYDVSAWNPSDFLATLETAAVKLAQPPTIQTVLKQALATFFVQPDFYTYVGSHISKVKPMLKGFKAFYARGAGRPCQMFLVNPRTGKRAADTAKQIPAARDFIKENSILYFTHAAYTINLCANATAHDGSWAQRSLNEDIQQTVELGGRGVVVHTGQKCGRSEAEALKIMEEMIREALAYATEACPVLLETPCGEGTEVCATIQDLGGFFYRFTDAERTKLGVCIDTAHIFGAGYPDPLVYLEHWTQHCPVPIGLVHFNDSDEPCGSFKDRHAAPGHGHIGIQKMTAVAEWCRERHIPMVRE